METAELLERCRQRDELAWEVLVRQYQSRVYGIAYALVGNAEDARDVSQDVFIRLYKKLNKCRDPEMFVPWMTRIARNAAIDFLRRRKARPQRTETPVEEMIDLRADGNNPEEQYEVETRKHLVYSALQKLSGISRENMSRISPGWARSYQAVIQNPRKRMSRKISRAFPAGTASRPMAP